VLYHPSTIFTFNVKFSTKIHEKIRWVRKTEKETETEEEGRERIIKHKILRCVFRNRLLSAKE
jgi:hypothetical protein